MRIARLVFVFVAVVSAVTFGSVAGQAADEKTVPVASGTSVPVAQQFAMLKGVKAVPMASRELDAVKGTHVHFLDAGGGKLHLAGDVKTENNWTNIGGDDGLPVAPSYHGLCVAHSVGAIFIPTRGGIQTQCP